MKGLILYNVKAGKGKVAKRLERIVAEFTKEGIEVTPKLIDFVENPFNGHEDIDLVVICGGDGTINYVVNQMREKGIDPTIGVIPAGTANDFAGALGMPKDYVKAARKIAQGREHRVDCGEVNGRYFVNVLSFGVLTTTSQQTSDKAKHRYGKLAYLWVGLKDLITMHSIKLRVKIDDQEFDADTLMFLVFNGETAGRFHLAHGAKIDDGLFDVMVLERRNAIATCVNMVRHLLRGKPKAVHHLQSSLIEIYTDGKERTDVDGQPGPDFPMYVRCQAGALKVRS